MSKQARKQAPGTKQAWLISAPSCKGPHVGPSRNLIHRKRHVQIFGRMQEIVAKAAAEGPHRRRSCLDGITLASDHGG